MVGAVDFGRVAGNDLGGESEGRTTTMDSWYEFLDGVIYTINARVLKVHSFMPSQPFLGFNARTYLLDKTVVETLRRSQLGDLM